LNATLSIRGENSLGTGFFVSDDGHILTNRHVVSGMNRIKITTYHGKTYRAKLEEVSDHFDIALLKIEGYDHPTLKIGDATKLFPGDTVYSVGNPRGLSFTITKGIVSYVNRLVGGTFYIQSDVAINPGNSGGPLVNSKGEVIGINTWISTRSGGSEGLSFSLPINYAYQSSDAIAYGIIQTPKDFSTISSDTSAGHVKHFDRTGRDSS